MAINFLNSLNINKNSVEQLRVVNHINDAAAGTGVVGQLYYQTGSGNEFLKVYRQTSFEVGNETFAWKEVGGGVTSLTTSNGTFINLTPTTAQVGDVSVSADLSATGTANSSSFLAGNNAWAIPAGTYSWTVKGDGAENTAVASGETVTILGGTNISATLSTRTITIAYTGGSGTMSNWNLAADSGATLQVDNGETVDIAGGTHITTTMAGTAAAPSVSISTDATSANTADTLMSRDGSGFSNVATPATGDSSTRVATTAFVKSAIVGLIEFKSGFNATTGLITGGTSNLTADDSPATGDVRVAILVGDMYVVTTAGNFYGNAAYPLTPGDSVICQTDAPAGTSDINDWVIVQSDTDLATATTVGIGNVNNNTNGGTSVSYTTGTAKISLNVDNLVAGSGDPVTVAGEDSSGNTKKFTIDSLHNLRGKRVALNDPDGGASGITRSFASNVTTFTLEIDSVWDSSIDVRNVTIETTSLTSGDNETVYADTTRKDDVSPQQIIVKFAGEVANNVYQLLLQNVG